MRFQRMLNGASLLHLTSLCQGTDFMLQLADWLRDWAADKVTSDSRFKHCSFIISDASEPGEGEHKVIMTHRGRGGLGCFAAAGVFCSSLELWSKHNPAWC